MEEDWNIILSVLESPESSLIGQQKVFTTSPISIGRSEDSDFVILEPTVSRQHCTIRITSDYSRVFITDQSTHGTVVSGREVPKGPGSGFTLQDGDNIKIGNTSVKYEIRLKQSVQSTLVGKIDRSFLDGPPPGEEPPQEEVPGIIEPRTIKSRAVAQEKKSNPLVIVVIVVCILVLAFLIISPFL